MENKKFFTYTLIAACLICLVAVYFRVFTDMELPGRIMAAILGVVITASITQLLLEGQTEKELRLKRKGRRIIKGNRMKSRKNGRKIRLARPKNGKMNKLVRQKNGD